MRRDVPAHRNRPTTIDILPSALYGFRAMFTDYITRWNLTPDGDPIVTHSSRLLPVQQSWDARDAESGD